MTLTLRYQARTGVPVEVEGIVPTAVRDRPLADIERLEIHHGNRKLPLGELFQVSGDPSDSRMVWEGDLSGVHYLGAGMDGGEIRVAGHAGRHLGSQMSAGTIDVEGDASDWLGAQMRAGLIRVRGRAGNAVGGAYAGSIRGMTGGTILVHGPAGDEVCCRMRRGLVAVGGAGEAAGYSMLAGTLLVFGPCGERPGADMRRGTIGLLGDCTPRLLPTFRYGCRFKGVVVSLLAAELRRLGWAEVERLEGVLELFHGDMVALGRGEIWVRE
jgi:formylmethanofuran dehydrogenase subunit C